MFPSWLGSLAWLCLGVAFACAAWIAIDEIRHPQHMWIMNIVWPVSALFGSVLWLALYLRHGRARTRAPRHAKRERSAAREAAPQGESGGPRRSSPGLAAIAKATTHCGAGCMLGDICGEFLTLLLPTVAIAAGWTWLFDEKIYANWIVDFIFAYLIGIAIQYFTITPMKNLSPGRGLVQALKADTASIALWQVGMYGAMAAIQFLWFRRAYGTSAAASTPEFWFAMQLAMLCGFGTSFPANAWLLRRGIKQEM